MTGSWSPARPAVPSDAGGDRPTRRTFKTSLHLLALVVAVLVPLLVFVGLLVTRYAALEERRFTHEALERARATTLDIDRDLTGLRATIQTLATSSSIPLQDFAGFQRRATSVRNLTSLDIVLRDLATNQQIVNTRVPWGTPLPKTTTSVDDELRRTKVPLVIDVYFPQLAGNRPLYGLAAPVLRPGSSEVGYMLAFSIPTERLLPLIDQSPARDWTIDVVDRAGLYLARSEGHDDVTGKPSDDFLRRDGEEGTWTGAGPDGRAVLVGYTHSKVAGWLVAASIPLAIVRTPLVEALQTLAILGVGALLLSLSMASWFGRRFSVPLGALNRRAEALGRGETVTPVPTRVREIDAVGTVMATASHALRERTRERDAAETALRESEARQRLVLESATEYAIITTTLDGHIVSWSAGAQKTFGWEARETINHHVRLIFLPEDQASGKPEAEFQRALAEGGVEDGRWHLCRTGTRIWAAGELHPLRGPDGAAVGFLKILRDRTRERDTEEAMRRLTETLESNVEARTRELSDTNRRLVSEMQRRETTEDQLRQLQKMEAVGQLTGGIAHDFNNMLAVVIGSLNLLEKRLARGETAVERFVDAAMDGATRAATLTQRLLAFSRQQPLAPEVVDANRLVAGMSELLRRTLGEEVKLETVLAGGLWPTHADPSQLENAVLNLAVNGRDALTDGGRLTIETANCHLDEGYAAHHLGVPAGQFILIAVTDDGAGMTPEVVAKAFDPFFTTKPVGRGTGLGLSQVYGFVRQTGGHIKIYSEPGQGTTVKIYLPRFLGSVDAVPATSAAALRDLPEGNRREVILVVEDEDRVRQFTVEALRDLGYTVVHAEGAVKALRQLDAHPDVRLLLTDIVMPDVNGRKLADEALRRRPDLKILFATGYTRNAVVHNGMLDHGVNLITKPFTLEQLAVRVRGVLGPAGIASSD